MCTLDTDSLSETQFTNIFFSVFIFLIVSLENQNF